jgi:hypothetical protein
VIERGVVYVMRHGKLVPKDEAPQRHAGPYVQSDIPAYKSPLGNGVIDGRSARREELKRNNCREVDPSEWRPTYRNPNFAQKRGLSLSRD